MDNDSNPLDQIEQNDKTIIDALNWWEKRRKWFTISVGISGILGIALSYWPNDWLDYLGILFWGILANILYSTGFVSEALDYHYFNRKFKLDRFRVSLFIVGTVLYSITTFVFALIYFTLKHVPYFSI